MPTKSKAVVDEDGTEVVKHDVKALTMSARQNAIGNITALTELRAIIGQEVDWQEIEPSFEVVKDKAMFDGIPLIVGAFRFNESDKFAKKNEQGFLEPSEFVSVLCAGYDPDDEILITPWVIVNDGSTGIKDQLHRYASHYDDDPQKCPPLRVSKGLRRSDYDYTDSDGNVTAATTWYLG